MMQLQVIRKKIFEVRNERVMLDFDLAELYEVETKALNQAVKRNFERFPERYMFRLTAAEWKALRSQIVTLEKGKGRHSKYIPYAFTEHGVSMLASVLKSRKAIQMNIAIVDAFISLKEFALNYKGLAKKIALIEKKNNKQFKDLYEAINYLLHKDGQEKEQRTRKKIGFKNYEE